MRSVRSERRARWTVGVLAGLVGVAVGLAAPRAEPTAAAYVDSASVGAAVHVRTCSGAWAAQVAASTPIRHLDFAATSALPGDVPAPGLLVCDPSGALTLHGGLEEFQIDPGGGMASGAVLSVAVWAAITDVATPGDLLWLTQADGYGLGLRVSGGLLQVVEVLTGGGPVAVLAQTTAPTSDPHLLTMTRSGADLTLYVDTAAVATATLSATGTTDVYLFLGAPPGSGASAAQGVLDEVVVLPATLGPGGVADLVAADTW